MSATRSFIRRASPPALFVGLVLSALHLPAAPMQTIAWDFNVSSQAIQWTSTNTYATTPVPQDPRWTWVAGAGAVPGAWEVDSIGVSSPATRFGNLLTSPLIQLSPATPADKFRFSFAHRHRMPTDGFVVDGVQIPVVAGQFEYSLDGQKYLPVFPSDWVSSGTIPSILAPYVQSSSWAVPQFVPGVAPVVSLPPLVDGGATFTGTSAGRDAGWFVASQTLEVDIPGLTETIQFRFTKMDLGPNCGLDAGWDLRFAEADLILAPEPGGTALAASAGLAVAVFLLRRHQRASRPSVRPCTNTPPAVSVAARTGSSGHRHWSSNWLLASASPSSQKAEYPARNESHVAMSHTAVAPTSPTNATRDVLERFEITYAGTNPSPEYEFDEACTARL